MYRFLRQSITWLLLLLVSMACSEAPVGSGWRTTGDPVGAANVGMWGGHDGWSIIEEVRFGAAADDDATSEADDTVTCAAQPRSA